MTKRELSAWADALVTLLDNGQSNEVRRILKSVIIPPRESEKESKSKDK